jgi:hypothetical protein
MFIEILLLCDARVFSCDASVYAIHVNPGEVHDVGDDDGSYGSCCNTRVSTLVIDIESGASALHDFGAFFLWNVKLRQDHGELSLISLELGVIPCLEEDSVIVSLMFHGDIGAYVDARVEDLRFEDSNPKMDMQIWRLALKLCCDVLV